MNYTLNLSIFSVFTHGMFVSASVLETLCFTPAPNILWLVCSWVCQCCNRLCVCVRASVCGAWVGYPCMWVWVRFSHVKFTQTQTTHLPIPPAPNILLLQFAAFTRVLLDVIFVLCGCLCLFSGFEWNLLRKGLQCIWWWLMDLVFSHHTNIDIDCVLSKVKETLAWEVVCVSFTS